MTQKRANCVFGRARGKAGVHGGVVTHDMRTHWITTLLAAGTPVDLAARYAGHTVTVLELYRQWIRDREAEFAAYVAGTYEGLVADRADPKQIS